MMRDNYKYDINIQWNEKEQYYIASVPELVGCMADGETLEEVMKNIQESIQIWIEVNIERGMEIPVPKSVKL